MSNYKHWEMQVDASEIIWLGFNRKDASVNTINDEVLDELNSLLHEITKITKAKGLIIYSLKTKGFIAGADVNAFSSFKNPTLAVDFLRKGQAVFSYLESLTIPTLAMIDGSCFSM